MSVSIHRRKFLTASLGIAFGARAFSVIDAVAGEKAPVKSAWKALGTQVALTMIPNERETSEAVFAEAREELERIEQVMSLYREDSQICRLNRNKIFKDPDPRMLEVLTCARDISMLSEGAFDVTVQPLWDIFFQAKRNRAPMTDKEILDAKTHVDWRRVHWDASEVRLEGEGTAITLNGIAQGYATDRILRICRRRGVRHALIDCGEIASLGEGQEGRSWTVGIQHPRDTGAYAALVKSDGRCLATSGDYATSFSGDFKDHHLFDPRTGRSPEELSSVTIAANNSMQADALSTAVFVMGVERGLKMIGNLPNVDAFLTLKNGKTFATPGFPVMA